MLTFYGINVCYYVYIFWSHSSKLILTTEEVITPTLKIIQTTTKVILDTNKMVSGTDQYKGILQKK